MFVLIIITQNFSILLLSFISFSLHESRYRFILHFISLHFATKEDGKLNTYLYYIRHIIIIIHCYTGQWIGYYLLTHDLCLGHYTYEVQK